MDPKTGTVALDALFVTPGASVSAHATWNAHGGGFDGWWVWRQIVRTDALQAWRESTDDVVVALRFFIAISPALISWYYLTLRFEHHVCGGGVMLMWIMILLPAALLFVSIGAWIPAVGCVACVVAIHNAADNGKLKGWGPLSVRVRHALLFVMASCNSIQFVWMLVLVSQAGYTAFFYDLSLRQLYSMSYSLIIGSGAPASYVAIMLPSIMALTLCFMLGAVLCLVLELLHGRDARQMAVRGGAC